MLEIHRVGRHSVLWAAVVVGAEAEDNVVVGNMEYPMHAQVRTKKGSSLEVVSGMPYSALSSAKPTVQTGLSET